MKDLKESWIPVGVTEGLFSDELIAKVKLANGENVSLFADKDVVKHNGDKNYLKVFATVKLEKVETRTVLLPTEAFETSSRWIEVPSKEVNDDIK